VTIDDYYELFNGLLNPKQLEGLRLLVTPFPQQQFNQTEDRRSERPSLILATRLSAQEKGDLLAFLRAL